MKRFCFINLMVILVVALVAGCQTAQNIKSSISTQVTSITSDVDPELYAQVPEDNKERIPEAEFNLELNNNKEKLAKLKKELGIQQLKIAGYNLDLASKDRKKAAVALDIKKIEAIDMAGLGEKEDNINTIADLKAKILNIEGDKVKIEAKIANVQVIISDLKKQVDEQEEKVEGMEME